MVFTLGDVFIGDHKPIQEFGLRPDLYSARYNLKGHNGIDFATPELTPILAAADGFISEAGFDTLAYGNIVKIVHDGFLTAYGHLNDIAVKLNERVVAGQLLGHSGKTGVCDTPHLHFGVAPCDRSGNKTQKDNGYGGYIDPMNNTLVQWLVKRLEKPINPTEVMPTIPQSFAEHTESQAQKTQYQIIVSYLQKAGLNEWLKLHNLPPVDLESNPADMSSGEHIIAYIGSLLETQSVVAMAEHQAIESVEKARDSFFLRLRKSLPFIFTQP